MPDQENHTGDIAFKRYLDSIDSEKKNAAAHELDALDLDTPEGIETAKQLLDRELDFRFVNAHEVAKDAIGTIRDLLRGNSAKGHEYRKALYKRRIGEKEYAIIEPPPELLEIYRKEVENISALLKTNDQEKIAALFVPGARDGSSGNASGERRMRGDVGGVMQMLASGQMNDQRYTLLAISILTGVNRSRGLDTDATGFKLTKGDPYFLERVFNPDGQATCVDVSVLNKELASMFGIKSRMYIDEQPNADNGRGHRFLITENDEVLDPWTGAGFFLSREDFQKEMTGNIVEEDYDLEL